MRDYVDNTYMALENVILSYDGQDIALNIPDHFGDMPVEKIGDGAFMEADGLRQAVVPKSVRSIGEQAFYRCWELHCVYLPGTVETIGPSAFSECEKLIYLFFYDLPLSREQYTELKSMSLRTAGGEYLSRCFPAIPAVRQALCASDIGAGVVPAGIERLFAAQSLPEAAGRESLTRNLERYEFAGRDGKLTEEDVLPRLIEAGARFTGDSASECESDWHIRMGFMPGIEKTAIFTFDDSKTRTRGRDFLIRASIKFGYFFWQSLIPLRQNGKQYYLYCRRYLTPDSRVPYSRQDVAIFSRDSLITDKTETRAVYAKYKLLSIL